MKLQYRVQTHQTDVLVIGGGLGGLAAAIKARENGAEVIVLEKAHTDRSGLAGSGIDHIQAHIPEFHNLIDYSEKDLADDQYGFAGNFGGFRRRDLIDLFARHSGRDIRELENYGLKFRFKNGAKPGGFHIVPQFHHVPTSYHFEGRDVKRAMTKKARELGALILNRIHVRQLLTHEGAVTGAIAVGVREQVIVVVTAKTTILATSGSTSRLTSSVTSGDSFEFFLTPSASTGSGKILAAKAGAEIVNLEFVNLIPSYTWVNYSFTVGLPSGSWWPAGRIVDEEGNVVVERNRDLPVDEPDYKQKYKALVNHYYEQRGRVAQLLAEGKSLYFDLQEATDDELAHILWSLDHEGKTGVLKHHLEKNGVDFKTARFPLRLGRKESPVWAGVWVKYGTTETNVRNLYATGNEPSAGLMLPVAGEAIVFGFYSGKEAALQAKETAFATDVSAPYVEELLRQIEEVVSADSCAASWTDAERGLKALLDNVLGKPYTEKTGLQALELLRRQRAALHLRADDSHELSRVFEVQDLYDLAELTIVSIIERKSSLGPFVRLDEKHFPAERYGESVAVWYEDGVIKTGRRANIIQGGKDTWQS